jgi:methylated-DNA-protein-cysteine methyltransferase-like protein
MALKNLPDNLNLRFNGETVPWQRIINSKGLISPRGVDGATRQAIALRREGVTVERNAMGEYSIDLSNFGWFPEMLPSEEEEDNQD